jgi:hypothetical protein
MPLEPFAKDTKSEGTVVSAETNADVHDTPARTRVS